MKQKLSILWIIFCIFLVYFIKNIFFHVDYFYGNISFDETSLVDIALEQSYKNIVVYSSKKYYPDIKNNILEKYPETKVTYFEEKKNIFLWETLHLYIDTTKEKVDKTFWEFFTYIHTDNPAQLQQKIECRGCFEMFTQKHNNIIYYSYFEPNNSIKISEYFSQNDRFFHDFTQVNSHNSLKDTESVSWIFFWDFHFAQRWYGEMVRREKATPEWLLQTLSQAHLSMFDIVSGNFESSIYKDQNDCQYSQKQNIIKTHEKYIQYFKNIGISHVSLANNHSYDCGDIWFQATKKYLEENQIVYFWEWRGNESNILLQEIKGQKIAFIWLNDTTYPVNWESKYKKIAELEQQNYFIIINIHWGNEYKIKNNVRQKLLAEKFIEHWADLIIGHHPHVVQNYEIIDNVPVFYSLWNFMFDQPMEETLKGMGVLFLLEKDILKVKPIYFYRDQKFMKIQYFSNQ